MTQARGPTMGAAAMAPPIGRWSAVSLPASSSRESDIRPAPPSQGEGLRLRRRPVTRGLVSVAGNPTPPRPHLHVVDGSGVGLRTVSWLPPRAARGTVLLLLGRGDFVEKYFEVVHELLDRGWAVTCFDWRGQGGSERLHPDPWRGHVDSFGGYVADVSAVADTVLAHLPRPVVGLAHSMGAAILLHALAMRPDLVARAVLTAPMLALSPRLAPPGARAAVRVLKGLGLGTSFVPGPTIRAVAMPRFDPDNLLTSDPLRYLRSYEILAEAPHLGVGKPTIGWLHAAYAGMDGLRAGGPAASIATPLLLVAGDRDRVTHTPAAVAFAAAAPTRTCVVIEGAAHDVMLERNALRNQVLAAFDAFAAEA